MEQDETQEQNQPQPESSLPRVSRRKFLQTAGVIGASVALSLRGQAQEMPVSQNGQPEQGGAAGQDSGSAGGGGGDQSPTTVGNPAPSSNAVKMQSPPAPGPKAGKGVPTGSEYGEGDIPQRALGKTGLTISAIGCGGHHIGDAESVNEAMNIVHEAMDFGVNFFDNCWEYHNGKSEDWLGRALAGGRRDKAVLMTKVCTHGRSARVALQMLEESLRRLQTDHLDVWQIHAVTYDNDPELAYAKDGVLEAFDRAKQQGKVRFVGFTGHKDPGLHLKMLEMGYPFDTVQMPLNPFDHGFFSFEQQVLPELNRRGVAPLGMKSMGGTADPVKRGLVTAEELLRYAMSLPVATTICGIDSLDVLHQNLRVARGFKPMSTEEMDELRTRCAPTAGDGRYELYKVSIKYDNPMTRMPHGFPIDQKQKEVQDFFKSGIGLPGTDEITAAGL